MAAGLEVFNADGSTRTTVTTQMTRVVGSRSVSGSGSFAWPYPEVAGRRAVLTASNSPLRLGLISTACAQIAADGRVTYNQGEDVGAFTIVFLVY